MSKADKLPTDKHGRLDLGKPQTHLNKSLSRKEIGEFAYEYGWKEPLTLIQDDLSMAHNRAICQDRPALRDRLREELVACMECNRSLTQLSIKTND